MKVLVLSSARCGGRYFCEQLALNHNLTLYHEPDIDTIKYIVSKNNIIVKTVVNSPFHYDTEKIIEYTKSFDTIFLLTRRNNEDHLISLYELLDISHDMYTKYFWDETNRKQLKKATKWQNFIDNLNKCLKELSYRLNEDIIYYEDLYYKTETVNLKGLKFEPDLSKKLRVDGVRTTI